MANQNASLDGNQNFSILAAAGTSGTAETIKLTATADGALNVNASVTAGDTNPGTASNSTANYFAVRLTDGTSYYNASGGGGGGTTVTVDHGTITVSNPTGTTVQFNNGSVDLLKAGTITRLEGGTINNSGTTTGVGVVSSLSAGTITKLEGGTLGLVTTLSNLSNGSVRVTAGTVGGAGATAVALSGNPVPVGGVDSGGTVYGLLTDAKGQQLIGGGTISMINAATVSVLPNIPGGTLALVTTLTNLSNGTIQNSGTTTGVGTVTDLGRIYNAGTVQNQLGGTLDTVTTVTNLTNGSVRITVGTITVLPNIPGGTIGVVTSITGIASGTINNSGTTTGVGVVSLLSAGTITKLEQGSINVTAGTVTAGTINLGTISARTSENVLTYGTQFAATAAAYGTLVGSAVVGAGTSTWLQNASIINPAGTVLTLLGFGTVLNGTSVLYRGVLGTQTVSGIQKSWDKAVNAGMTNQDLVIYLGAAGTVDVSISYFIKI